MEFVALEKKNIAFGERSLTSINKSNGTDTVKTKSRKRCGEVFIDEEDHFNFVCTICEASFDETKQFFSHIKGVHNNETINQADPLGPDNNVSRASRHEPNVQITTIDNAEIILPEYGEESIDSLNSNSNAELREDENSASTDDEKRVPYSTRRHTLHNQSDKAEKKQKDNCSVKEPIFDRDCDAVMTNCETKPICNKCGKSFSSLKNLKRHNQKVNCSRSNNLDYEKRAPYKNTRHTLINESSRNRTSESESESDGNESEEYFNKKDPTFDIDYEIATTKKEKFVKRCRIKPVCHICGKSFASLKGYKRHRREINCSLNKMAKSTVCETCGKNLSSRRSLQKHQNSRTCGHNKKREKCHKDKTSDDVSNGESDNDPTKCRYCDRHLADSSKRVEHERIHTGEKPFQCQKCGKCFRTLSLCTAHERLHTTKRLFKCIICDAAFKSKGQLYTHTQRHGEKRFPCSYCEKSFFQKSERKEHERFHTGEKPYKCELCDRAFQTSSSLQVHNRKHLNIRPHKCEYCGSCFFTKPMLRNHIVIHTGERPFVCTICNATFPRRKGLKSHEKLHLHIRKYGCTICNEGFKDYSGLYYHMGSSHGTTPASQLDTNITM